ncbi:MAG: RimK family alpha-L-glutamate ligase [Clostridium sp.]|nr:RimK family alpha-L-glutamate ligase [Clostridium sp.]
MQKNDVTLCVTILREEEKRIVKYLQEFGFKVNIVTDSKKLEVVNSDFDEKQVAFIRCLSQSSALKRATLCEMSGLDVINSKKAIEICTSKICQSILFKRFNVPQPRYEVVFSSNDFYELFEKFNGCFVIKPSSASWGRGIARITSKECLDIWLAGREALDPGEKNFPVLVQEFVDKGNFDIRVVVVGDKPIVAFKRVSEENWKTNTHLGAEVEPIEINKDINEICKKVIDVLGEGIYGIDLFYDNTRKCYLVCEVNQNPEFAHSWKIHKVDVAYYIAKYIGGRVLKLREYDY